ncbi:endothelin-converting enzyme 1-like protein [Aphelenchoides avenae]|nr:endothelin-converting enzyme 1-like protein [Aphelenchus avenae]
MADLDGLKFASKALDIRQKRLGLPAASKREFFKSFAETACINVTPYAAKNAVWDVHSPWPVRVSEALRNTAEFAKSYGCKLGSPMNPAEKCYVWADEPISQT